MVIRLVAKLLALLNSNRRSVEIGASIAFGLWLALVPSANLLFAGLVLLAFLVKINLGMTIVSFLVFLLIVPAVDPTLNALGARVLAAPSLQDLYRSAYATPVVPFTRFNDTLVAGSFVGGAALFVPVTLFGMFLVRLYRKHVHGRIANSKLVKAIMASPLAQKIASAMKQVQRVWPTAG